MRKHLIAQRLDLSSDERLAAGARVIRKLRDTGGLGSSGTLGIYWPVRGEIDVRALALEHLRRGGSVGLPVVVQPFSALEFWSWDEAAPMSRGVWNIPIPARRALVHPDLLLVPLVGFDSENYRLGYGGGYYDRTLAAARPRPRCIGLGYASSRLDSIFPQQHDIPMDYILTDDGTELSG